MTDGRNRENRGRKNNNDLDVRSIALERIAYLHGLALRNASSDSTLSRNSIITMERLALRFDITLSPEIKRSYCKMCKTPYTANTRIRLKSGLSIITCSNCGDIRRLPYNH